MPRKIIDANIEVIYCSRCGHWNLKGWKICSGCKADLPNRHFEIRDMIAAIAVIISICAIAISFQQSQTIMYTNIQPLLGLESEWSDTIRSESLHNYGIGPAIITYMKFYNENKSSSNLRDIIRLPYNASPTYYYGGIPPFAIRREHGEIICNISSEDLKANGYNETQISEIMDAWDKEISTIYLRLKYTNAQGKGKRKFDEALGIGDL